MNQDFTVFRHREFCKFEMMDEARAFTVKHGLYVDWNYISVLIQKEQYLDLFLYSQGFIDPINFDERYTTLLLIYEILKDFFFEEP
jgi:hypothetical protein